MAVEVGALSPVATQALADAHATAARVATPDGSVPEIHVFPPSLVVRTTALGGGYGAVLPTAIHDVTEMQLREEIVRTPPGIADTDQDLEPSPVVKIELPPPRRTPAATHMSALGQAMEESGPSSGGDPTGFQVLPASNDCKTAPCCKLELPTAKQIVVVGQLNPFNCAWSVHSLTGQAGGLFKAWKPGVGVSPPQPGTDKAKTPSVSTAHSTAVGERSDRII